MTAEDQPADQLEVGRPVEQLLELGQLLGRRHRLVEHRQGAVAQALDEAFGGRDRGVGRR